MRERTLARLLIGVFAVVMVVACGNQAVTTAGGSTPSRSGGGTGSSAKAVTGPGVPTVAQDQTTGTVVPVPGDVVPAVGEGPRVIRTAQVSVEVRNGSFDSTVDKLFKISTDLGGYISGSAASADTGSLRTGTITFQVPTDKFSEAVSQVRALGRVQNLAIGGQDVSAQYVDLQARLKNTEAQRDAMLALLAQAKTVNDIIAVQTQVGQITSQIEQLKGQIAYYDHTTSYSTVAVSVHEAAVLLKPAPVDSWGFATAFSQGLHAFAGTLDYILVGVGYAGPFLILLGFGLVAWRLRRRFAL